MKNRIKKIAYAAASVGFFAPAIALAQFTLEPATTGLPTGSLVGIITAFMKWILYLVGIFGVIGFAVAGIMYLTASGNEDRVSSAKKAMLMYIVGVIVALIGLVVIQAVNSLLGESTTF